MSVRVLKVDKTEGEVTYVLSRGKQRVIFELKIKLKLEMEVRAGEELKQIVTLQFSLRDIPKLDVFSKSDPFIVQIVSCLLI